MKSRRIYKSLILILTISMLATSGMTIKVSASTAEQIQNQRLTNLESNDTNQAINNTEQQLSIDNLKASLANSITDIVRRIVDLTARVTNLENDPYPAMYMGWEEDIPICAPGETHFICREDIVNVSFYVPKDTFVLISSSGRIGHYTTNPITLTLSVTGDSQDAHYIGPKEITEYFNANNSANGFSISNTLKLTAGNYTAHLKGGTTETTTASEVSIGVITMQKGNLQ